MRTRGLDEVAVDAEEDDEYARRAAKIASCTACPVFAHATVAIFPVRR